MTPFDSVSMETVNLQSWSIDQVEDGGTCVSLFWASESDLGFFLPVHRLQAPPWLSVILTAATRGLRLSRSCYFSINKGQWLLQLLQFTWTQWTVSQTTHAAGELTRLCFLTPLPLMPPIKAPLSSSATQVCPLLRGREKRRGSRQIFHWF